MARLPRSYKARLTAQAGWPGSIVPPLAPWNRNQRKPLRVAARTDASSPFLGGKSQTVQRWGRNLKKSKQSTVLGLYVSQRILVTMPVIGTDHKTMYGNSVISQSIQPRTPFKATMVWHSRITSDPLGFLCLVHVIQDWIGWAPYPMGCPHANIGARSQTPRVSPPLTAVN